MVFISLKQNDTLQGIEPFGLWTLPLKDISEMGTITGTPGYPKSFDHAQMNS